MSLTQERNLISLDMENLTKFIYSYAYRTLPLSRIRTLRSKMLAIPDLSLNLTRYNDSIQETLIRSLKFGQA